MNISNSNGSSTDYSRITGLASGLDIDGLVKSMLANDQGRIDKASQAKQSLEWEQEAYVDIIKDLKKFYDYFDITKSNNILSSSNYVSTRSEATGRGVVISTYPGAVTGKYLIKTDSIAEPPSTKISTLQGTKKSSTLQEAGIGSFDYKIEIGGEIFIIEAEDSISVEELVSKIKNSKSQDNDKSLSSLVEVSFSELTGKLTITGKSTGENSLMKLVNNSLGEGEGKEQIFKGKDAVVRITPPGEGEIVYKSSSNSFSIDNVSYKVTEANGEVEFSVMKDGNESYNKFKVFIDSYNTLVEKINSKITEKKDYNYKPLSDSQKEEMSEDEIKKWESKAKQGILSRDNTLSALLTSLRTSLYETVEGAGLSLTDLGISTTANYNDGGKLQIDESKFKLALENDSEAVQKLFVSSGENSSQKGIFTRFKTIIDNAVGYNGTLIEKAGYENTRWVAENILSKKIVEKNDLIKSLLSKLNSKSETLYKRFSVLETNLNALNSQSSYIASQFS